MQKAEKRQISEIIGFIQDAKMALNIPQFTCQFLDNNWIYEFSNDDFASFPQIPVDMKSKPRIPNKRLIPGNAAIQKKVLQLCTIN